MNRPAEESIPSYRASSLRWDRWETSCVSCRLRMHPRVPCINTVRWSSTRSISLGRVGRSTSWRLRRRGGSWRVLLPPESAGYVQLPQHLFWMDGSEGKAPESVDGLFWFVPKTDVIHVLPITGVLLDQPGFTALALPEAPLGDAQQWLDADMRGTGTDYASSLPGHDLDRLYSVESAGEVLKLLARFFAYLESTPAAREDVAGGGRHESPRKGPRPSALPYARVRAMA